MLKSYQGYFDNGQFIPLDNIPILEMKRVIITVLDDDAPVRKQDFDSKRYIEQRLAFETFFKAIDIIGTEPLSETDFYELEHNRVSFKRDLTV